MSTDPQKEFLLKMANMKMPFGKYQGRYLIELPEHYLVWYRQKGFPNNQLGLMMEQVLDIKINGLEKLIYPLIKK